VFLLLGFGQKLFNFLPFGSKNISRGQVKKYPGQSQASPLFTADQGLPESFI